jgi:hypothetical protein
LPGGYFWVKSGAKFSEAESQIVREAKRTGIAVAIGIDYSQKKQSKKKTRSPNIEYLVQTQALPSFAVTWSPDQGAQIWRQRSVSTKDQRFVSEKEYARPQTLHVSGSDIEILSCGELFNERIRNSVIGR